MKTGDGTRNGVHGWGLIAGLVALAGVGWVAVPFFGLGVLGSDSCRSPDERPICDPSNQKLVVMLPLGALVVGLLLAGIGGGLAVRRRRSAPWQLGAWLLVLVAGLVSCGIATAGPSAEYQRRQAEQEGREKLEWIEGLKARPDYEVMRARFEQMQQHIQTEMQTTLPHVEWPLLLDDRLGTCGGDGPRAMRIRDYAAPDADLTDDHWIALDAVVRRVTLAYGFTGPPLRLHPARAPTGLELHGPDQAHLRVYATGTGQFRVTFESACGVRRSATRRRLDYDHYSPTHPRTGSHWYLS